MKNIIFAFFKEQKTLLKTFILISFGVIFLNANVDAASAGCFIDGNITPTSGIVNSTTFTLSYNASTSQTDTCPGTGLAEVKFFKDEGTAALSGTGNSRPFQYSSSGTYHPYVEIWKGGVPVNVADAKDSFTVIVNPSDTTLPFVSVTGAPSSWTNSTNIRANVGCSDSGSGCNTSSYKLYISLTSISTCPQTPTSYTTSVNALISTRTWICATATDIAGNQGYSTTPVEFKVDQAAPTGGSIIYPNASQTNTSIIITVAPGTDSLSGMSSTPSHYLLQYQSATLSGSTCGTFSAWQDAGVTETATATSYPFTGASGKCYKFQYTVKDVAGNSATWTSTNITKIEEVVTTQPPTVYATPDAPTSWITEAGYSVTPTATGESIAEKRYTFGTTPPSCAAGAPSGIIFTSGTPILVPEAVDGSGKTLHLCARNEGGTTPWSSSNPYKVDSSPPTSASNFLAHLTNATGQAITTGTVLTTTAPTLYFSWNAGSDAQSNIQSYRVTVREGTSGGPTANGTLYLNQTVTSALSHTWNSTLLDGGYVYKIETKNNAGLVVSTSWIYFAIDSTPTAPNGMQVCQNWGGTWSDSENAHNGICSFVNNTSTNRLALHKDIVAVTTPLICQKIKMVDDAIDRTNATYNGCLKASNAPLWAAANFELPPGGTTYQRKTADVQYGVNLSNKTLDNIDCTFDENTYFIDDYQTGNPGRGDFCPQKGQKLLPQADIDYTKSSPRFFFTGCGITENCECGSESFVPLGPDFEFVPTGAGTAAKILSQNFDILPDRAPGFVESDNSVGQCLNTKLVKCLYPSTWNPSSNSDDSQYYKTDSGELRCKDPDGILGTQDAIYLWIEDTWSRDGCPDGNKRNSDGSCSACVSTVDEGSPLCCPSPGYYWNSGQNGGQNRCMRAVEYECSVLLPGQIGISDLSRDNNDYVLYDDYIGVAPSANYRSVSNTCRISCNDALSITNNNDLGIDTLPVYSPDSSTPHNTWNWRSLANTLDLKADRVNDNGSSIPYFIGTANGICDWQCAPGYVRDGNTCEEEPGLPDLGGGTVPDGQLPGAPHHPMRRLSAAEYDAITQKSVDSWGSIENNVSTDNFLSPAKNQALSDFVIRFRIPNVSGIVSIDNTIIAKWSINGKDSNGDAVALNPIIGCLDDSDSDNSGSNLCAYHFANSGKCIGGNCVYIPGEENIEVQFKNLEGRNSLTGNNQTISDFLKETLYPELSIAIVNPIRDTSGQILTSRIEYQVLVPSDPLYVDGDGNRLPTIPAGNRIIYAEAVIGDTRRRMELVIDDVKGLPLLKYTLFND